MAAQRHGMALDGLDHLRQLGIDVAVAIKSSRRILMPLSSVAASLRRLADGDLDARAAAPTSP